MIDISKVRKSFYTEVYGEEISITKDTDIILNEKDREGVRLNFEEKLSSVITDNKYTKKNLDLINEQLKLNVDRLNFKINKAVEKLRGAILVERNTTSTIYSTIIPITKQQTNTINTTATISDNIIFGISNSKIDRETITALHLKNISFKNLNIKSINKTATDLLEDLVISNKTHNSLPFEFTIDVRGLLKGSTSVILGLKDFAILEVYKNDSLFREKTLSNYYNIPVDLDTQSITIRSYPTMHKSSDLNFDIIGLTEFIYQNSSTYETKQIPINKSLSNIVIDTCDNSIDTNINIEYYISINNKEYERFLPVKKNNSKNVNNLQSIITLSKDSELSLLGFSGVKIKEGDIRYQLPDSLQNFLEYQTWIYVPNLKEGNTELFLLIKEDTTIDPRLLNPEAVFFVDDNPQEEKIFLPKGIRKLQIISEDSSTTFDYNYLKLIIGENNIYSHKVLKPILKTNENIKYLSFSTPEILEYFGTTEPKQVFIKDSKKEIVINTIKIKSILSSVDKKTVPYISRILIRGL